MHPDPASDPVCGNCAAYEPSRTDAKYGYCGPHEALERDKCGGVTGRLVDITTPCYMVVWRGAERHPAFRPKEPICEKNPHA